MTWKRSGSVHLLSKLLIWKFFISACGFEDNGTQLSVAVAFWHRYQKKGCSSYFMFQDLVYPYHVYLFWNSNPSCQQDSSCEGKNDLFRFYCESFIHLIQSTMYIPGWNYSIYIRQYGEDSWIKYCVQYNYLLVETISVRLFINFCFLCTIRCTMVLLQMMCWGVFFISLVLVRFGWNKKQKYFMRSTNKNTFYCAILCMCNILFQFWMNWLFMGGFHWIFLRSIFLCGPNADIVSKFDTATPH
jgi:hypothetical protein